MARVEGDLSLMPVTDIMQWIEISQKTGTLLLESNGILKRFYFQDGKIIYVSSQKKGELLGEYLLSKKILDIKQLKDSVQKSQMLGLPFTGYLISEGFTTMETLESIITEIAETAFLDILKWDGGTFQFSDTLPPAVVNGPVKINTSYVMLQSLKEIDESEKNKEVDKQTIIQALARDISSGKLELPPLPDIIAKLNRVMEDENTTSHDIARIIMSDQILTSKILKIANSSFYARHGKISSLQQAIVYMGLKSLISIVTIYTFGNSRSPNANRIKEVLKHSLLTGFVARHLSPYLSVDPEEAFVCGLLHDIGKTVILDHISNQQLTDEDISSITEKFHSEVGFLLSVKWKFSDILKETIRLHHRPEEAERFKDMLKIINLANEASKNLDNEEKLHEILKIVLDKGLNLKEFIDDLNSFVKDSPIFV